MTLVFIHYVPDNQRKLELHNAIQELTEKLFNFKKTDRGMADPTATVEYQGHKLHYTDLMREKGEAWHELEQLIKKSR